MAMIVLDDLKDIEILSYGRELTHVHFTHLRGNETRLLLNKGGYEMLEDVIVQRYQDRIEKEARKEKEL